MAVRKTRRTAPQRRRTALRAVKMLVTDVDGVLTDGSIVIHADGSESKVFNVRDGSGIKMLERSGIKTVILSARECVAVEHRARGLRMTGCVTGALEKLPHFRKLVREAGLAESEVCYVGDDLPDLPPMRTAGFPVAVADAVDEVKAAAAYVTKARGGKGAVREVAEMILRAQDTWDQVMSRYTA